MMATTVTKVVGGKALIPVINLRGDRTKLPGKKELGVWVPLMQDMQVMEQASENIISIPQLLPICYYTTDYCFFGIII